MILRRLTTAFRKQDWFTVAVETLIVVFGVFIGLQVNNWNTARLDRVMEQQLFVRIKGEVEGAIRLKAQWLDEIGAHRLALQQAIETIQIEPVQTTVSDEQCRAMWSSHLILYPDAPLSALDDLLAKGQMQTSAGRALHPVILRYRDQKELINQRNTALSGFANLGDTYSDAFPRSIIRDADLSARAAQIKGDQITRLTDTGFWTACLPELIRADRTVQNKLLSNLARTDGALQRVRIELSILEDIAAELDEAKP